MLIGVLDKMCSSGRFGVAVLQVMPYKPFWLQRLQRYSQLSVACRPSVVDSCGLPDDIPRCGGDGRSNSCTPSVVIVTAGDMCWDRAVLLQRLTKVS